MPNASNTPNSPDSPLTSSLDELAKSYEPAPIEAYWGPEWEQRGYGVAGAPRPAADLTRPLAEDLFQ